MARSAPPHSSLLPTPSLPPSFSFPSLPLSGSLSPVIPTPLATRLPPPPAPGSPLSPVRLFISPGPSVPGLQDSCLCLQCTFSDPRGRKRGAGCTVWDPVKRGPPPAAAQLSSLHPASTPPPRPPASLRLTQNPNLRRIPARGGGGGGEQGWKPEQVRMERGRVAAPGTGPRSPGQGGVGGTGTGPSPSLGRWRCHGDSGHRPLTGPLPTLSCLPPAPSPGLGAHVHLKGM